MQVPAFLLKGIEAGVNRWLGLDPDVVARLGPMAGKVIAVEVRGPDVTFYVAPHMGGVHLLAAYDGEPDTVLCGSPAAFVRLGGSSHPTRILFSGEVQIRGDVELGRRFKAAVDGMEIDWEEQLARIAGDVLAHQVGNMVRDTRRWMSEAVDTLSEDVAEYLHEESRLVPEALEIEEFLCGVDTLRSDADRLEQRISRLAAGLRGGPA